MQNERLRGEMFTRFRDAVDDMKQALTLHNTARYREAAGRALGQLRTIVELEEGEDRIQSVTNVMKAGDRRMWDEALRTRRGN